MNDNIRKTYYDVIGKLDDVRLIRTFECKLGLHEPTVEFELVVAIGGGTWVETGDDVCAYCSANLGRSREDERG